MWLAVGNTAGWLVEIYNYTGLYNYYLILLVGAKPTQRYNLLLTHEKFVILLAKETSIKIESLALLRLRNFYIAMWE